MGSTRRVHILAILALAISLYHYWNNAIFAHFNLDDYELIVLNPPIRSLEGLSDVIASGRPVRGLTLMLDYALFELNPTGYHMHNLVWHYLGMVLLYFLFYRIFKRPVLSLVSVLIFSIHPVHSEAVMAISHRKEMLAFTFMLASFHSYLYRDRRPYISALFSIVFFGLALLSKQVAAVLPLLILLHEWLKPGGKDWLRHSRALIPLVAIAVIIVIAGVLISAPVLRDFDLFGLVSPEKVREIGYGKILATSFSSFPKHITTMLLPVHLSVTHTVEVASWSAPGAWTGLFLFIALPVLIWRLRGDRILSFSLGWIFINLIPIMNWIPSNAFFAERYLYIPSAGICLIYAALLSKIFNEKEPLFISPSPSILKGFIKGTAVSVIMVSSFSPYIPIIWAESTGFANGPVATLTVSMMTGFCAGILTEISERKLNPVAKFIRALMQFVMVYLIIFFFMALTLATINLMVKGDFGIGKINASEGLQNMQTWLNGRAAPGPANDSGFIFEGMSPAAVILNFIVLPPLMPAILLSGISLVSSFVKKYGPNKSLAFHLLAILVVSFGAVGATRNIDWADELRLWKTATYEDPKAFPAWNNLGKAYMDRKRFDLAAQAFEKAIELSPERHDTYRNLGNARLRSGDLRSAMDAYRQALQLAPWDTASRLNLANIMVVMADKGEDPDGYKKAVQHYLDIIDHDPGSIHARNNLAYCYLQIGAYSRARVVLYEALDLDPMNTRARSLLQEVREAE